MPRQRKPIPFAQFARDYAEAFGVQYSNNDSM
jgi:hypothetical protein